MAEKRKKIFYGRILAGAISLAAILAVFSLSVEMFNLNGIARGVAAAGVPLGSLSIGEAVGVLEEKFAEYEKTPIILVYNGEKIELALANLGVSLDKTDTALKAYGVGRNENAFSGILNQMKSLFFGFEVRPEFFVDENKFSETVAEKISFIEKPAKNAEPIYDAKSGNFSIAPAAAGKIVDREALKAGILAAAAELKKAEISVSIIDDVPAISEEEALKAKERAEEILALSPYAIKGGEFKTELPKSAAVDFLEFIPVKGGNGRAILSVGFNEEEIKNYVLSLAPAVNREPVNAILAYDSEENKVKEFALSSDGYSLKIEESAAKIKNALDFGEKEIALEVETLKPAISTESIENLGIVSLLAKGESNFAGSPKSRVHNIKIAAAKFNGLLLKPGEEFSFVSVLGEVDEKGGYLPELVIKKDKTVPEYGGGVCQVSTTAFRAAIFAGLEILARSPHSFAVRYYEPQGMDATVYPPSPDLKFKNDTPAHLLMQTKIKGTKLVFEFYGTNDGREVRVDGPRIYDKKEDGSMKAVFYREIYKNGELIRKSAFRSNYKSPDLYPIERNPLE